METKNYYDTHNAVWSDSKGGWIEYENSNPPLRATFPMWMVVAMYETFVLPVLRFPAKIEASITRGLDNADEKYQNRNK